MSYFNILPDDVLLIIVSKLPTYLDTLGLRKSDYTFHKLLEVDINHAKLIRSRYPEFYTFIPKVKNIDYRHSWAILYNFLTIVESGGYSIYYEDTDRYLYDMWYSYLIYKEFPKFYDEVKLVNLSHTGILYTHRIPWSEVYKGLTKRKSFPFIQGNFGEKEYNTVIESRQNANDDLNTIRLCIYIHIKHGGTFSLYTLYDFFRFNFDIYEELKHKDMLKSVTELDVRSIARRSNEDIIFNMFIQDMER